MKMATPKSSNCSASTGPRSESVVDEDHPHMRESMKDLIDLYEAWGKPEKAKEWRAKLPQTEAVEE